MSRCDVYCQKERLEAECDALKAENTQMFAAWLDALKECDTLKEEDWIARWREEHAEVERLRQERDALKTVIEAHKCMLHFTAEDGRPAFTTNDGSDLRQALAKLEE